MALRTAVGELGSWETGSISIEREHDDVVLRVHWPFDRSSDEWVDLSTWLPVAGVRRAISEGSRGEARVEGSKPGHMLTLRSTGDRYTAAIAGSNSVGPVDLELSLSAEDFASLEAVLRHV